eukprot:5158527-Amphidinium_carterae.1
MPLMQVGFKSELQFPMLDSVDDIRYTPPIDWSILGREDAIAALQEDGRRLDRVDEQFRHDKEVVLVALRESGYSLMYASEALRADFEVVLTAVKQRGIALEFAAEALQNNR